jgi:uncharacterized protein (DUF302 family)
MEKMTALGMSTSVTGSMNEVKERVKASLKAQGFGVLTEIDMQKTLKEKLDVDIEPYQILGACNPNFANRALSADRSIGLLLPCNVVLRETGSSVEVSIQDPEVLFSVVDAGGNADFEKLPLEAKQLLQAALHSL